MKKLISIKSDESGENIYFTHKNGVDAIKKVDVVDLELLNPSKFRMTRSDGNSKLGDQIFIIAIIFFAVPVSDLENTFFFAPTFAFILIVGNIWILSQSFFSIRINTRNILKIFTKDKVLIFKITEDKDYQTIYLHFKHLLIKYFPKEGGDLILYKHNSKLKTTLIYLVVCDLLIGGFLLYGIICYLIYSEIHYFEFFLLVIALIFSILIFIMHRYQLNNLKTNINYFFKGKFIENKYKHSVDLEESVSIDSINKFIFVKNEKYLAVIPKDYKTEIEFIGVRFDNTNQYLEYYNGKQGGIWHNLKFSEEYRDIAPLIIEYLNDLSEELSENAQFVRCDKGHFYDKENNFCPFCGII